MNKKIIFINFILICNCFSSRQEVAWFNNNEYAKMEARRLVSKGENLDKKNLNGDTYMHDYAKGNFVDAARIFVQNGASCDISNDQGFKPLHFAASYGSFEFVKFLVLEKVVNINVKTFKGVTPYVFAVRNNYDDIAEFLLKNGADPNI